jgi:hypothetical protein
LFEYPKIFCTLMEDFFKILDMESWGTIIKEEHVVSLSMKVLSNTLVLETKLPFPGYFGQNIPDKMTPNSLFIVMEKDYEDFYIARTLQKISKEMEHKCYGAFGLIETGNMKYYCIRLKNLDCFENIPVIQKKLIEKGIQLHKYKQINTPALIRIKKCFLFEKIDEDIYKDSFEKDRYYISIPKYLDWEQFKALTDDVKNNIDNNVFDAALGFIWTLDGPSDIIRIYDKNQSLDRLREIRQKYLIALKLS